MIRALSLLRFRDWTHFLCLPLLSSPLRPVNGPRLALTLIAAASYLAFAYGYNQYQDTDLRELSSEALRERVGLGRAGLLLLLVSLVLICVVAGYLVQPWVAAVAAVGLCGSALYSGGVRLKRFPLVGSAANLWIFVPVVFFGGAPPKGIAFPLLMSAFCTMLLQSQLIHEASHRDRDADEGIRTTAVAFGPGATKVLSMVLGLASGALLGALAHQTHNWLVALAGGLIGLFSLVYALRVDFAETAATHRLRLAHRYVGLGAGCLAWVALMTR